MVVTEHPLKYLFRKADFSRRISRWVVELGQYDIKYQPRTAIKAQILADFIVGAIRMRKESSRQRKNDLGSSFLIQLRRSSSMDP